MAEPSELAQGLGKVLTNLLSLEVCLRLFLYDLQGLKRPTGGSTPPQHDFTNPTLGAWVPLTPLTSYETLGKLIRKVNSSLEERGREDRIDPSLVDLRDALAHGRVLSLKPEGPMRLVKFSKPCGDQVKVVASVELTQEWLKQQTQRTWSEIQKVVQLSRELGLAAFPA